MLMTVWLSWLQLITMIPWKPVLLVFVFTVISPVSTIESENDFYTLTPIKIGAEVRGIDLTLDPSPEVIRQIVRDTYRYKLLVFKDQKAISAQRHFDISKWFGEDVETLHRRHPKAEHPGVFRVRAGFFGFFSKSGFACKKGIYGTIR